MLAITREWVGKSESDFDVVSLLVRSRKPSRYDPICFHAQQWAEKYLKGRLTEGGVRFSKTHDLAPLLDWALPLEPLRAVFASRLAALSDWAVVQRYPGVSALAAQTRGAVRTCRDFRLLARDALGY